MTLHVPGRMPLYSLSRMKCGNRHGLLPGTFMYILLHPITDKYTPNGGKHLHVTVAVLNFSCTFYKWRTCRLMDLGLEFRSAFLDTHPRLKEPYYERQDSNFKATWNRLILISCHARIFPSAETLAPSTILYY